MMAAASRGMILFIFQVIPINQCLALLPEFQTSAVIVQDTVVIFFLEFHIYLLIKALSKGLCIDVAVLVYQLSDLLIESISLGVRNIINLFNRLRIDLLCLIKISSCICKFNKLDIAKICT